MFDWKAYLREKLPGYGDSGRQYRDGSSGPVQDCTAATEASAPADDQWPPEQAIDRGGNQMTLYDLLNEGSAALLQAGDADGGE